MKNPQAIIFTSVLILNASTASAVTVNVGNSSAAWVGFMNVSELPENGGAPAFSNGWGVPDLAVTFDDAMSNLSFQPNSINDVNEFWYQNTNGMAADPANPGGPGQLGNKSMNANLFVQVDDLLGGQEVIFEGSIEGFTLTADHTFGVFIRDFAPDFSSFNETAVPITAAGDFSITLNTDAGAGRHVQYGFQMTGENVWITDVAPFGNVTISTVPEPSSTALILLGAAGCLARRRRK